MEVLDSLEVETHADPTASVVWLHGLGADGHDFESIVPELGMPEAIPVRFVFPHAPERSITINQGMMMRAWYDITGFESERQEDNGGSGGEIDVAATQLVPESGQIAGRPKASHSCTSYSG